MKNFALTFLGMVMATTLSHGQSGAIRIEKVGHGEPVLFLPGFTCPGSVWKETVAQLTGNNECYLISYAGFNGIAPIDMPWYESIRTELLAFIEQEKLSDLRIVGHSMGGNLAVEIASALPDQVKSLVIVDAIPCMRELMMPGVPAAAIRYDNPYNQQMLEMADETFQQTATQMAHNMTNDPAKVDDLIKWAVEADRKTYVYGYTDLLKLDLRDALLKIKAPSLILGSSFPDKEVVTANFEKQYTNLAGKRIEIADSSRHFLMFDQPEWFYKKVNSFLAE